MVGERFIVGTGLRAKVERLLHGDARVDDLHELFFNMRHESNGRGLVSEIANFHAHPTRTQGTAWQEVRDYFAFLKFREPLSRRRIFTTDFPSSMPEAMSANLRRMRTSTLKRETGLKRIDAERILETILVRSIRTAGGVRVTVLTREEAAVFVCVASHLKGGPLFNDNDLFEDFCRALQSRGILHASEKQALKKSKPAISLFALTVMHNKTVDLCDGSVAKLLISPDIKKRLAIFAYSEVVKDYGAGSTTMGTWIFETGLLITDYCEPGVAPLERVPFIGDFEMTPQQKLARPT